MDRLLVGRYEHALDAKNRLVLPAQFRRLLEDGGYLVKDRDGCLALMSPTRFQEEADRLLRGSEEDEEQRNVVRWFASAASDVRPDSQGRVVIPPSLKEHAGLDRDCVIIGALDKVEIWGRDAFESFESSRSTSGQPAEDGER